jgi:uncharacterized membrane protein
VSQGIQLPESPRPEFGTTEREQPQPLTAVKRPRLDSIDRLRGLVMMLMALDHVRDFWGAITFDALDLTQTDVPLYFTRWISHYCAPTFVFLTGVGIYLYSCRGRTKPQVSWYLVTRGLWLVVVEALLLSNMWMWRGGRLLLDHPVHGPYYPIFGQVFWAIGASMVILSALIWLPRAVLLVFTLVLIGGHNAFDTFTPNLFGTWSPLWSVLHVQDDVWVTDHVLLKTMYPLIPWVAVMSAGYCFGPIMRMEAGERRRWLVGLGSCLVAGFFLLRWWNVYGDPYPWSVQKDGTFTVLSFLKCHKYPPSLCYLLMTIGPAILLLSAFEGNWGRLGNVITVFGRVPLFYYLLHVPLILGVSLLMHGAMGALAQYPPLQGIATALEPPYRLPGVYVVWVLTLVILYFPCRWYAGVKMRSSSPWLTYL